MWSLASVSALGADVPARLHWSRESALGTTVSGTVDAVVADVGDRVHKGQALVRLDQRPYKARLSEARARVKELAASRKEAGRELERAKNLYDRTVLAEHELQLARIADAKAEARLQAGRAALTQARVNLDYTVIRAPYEAWVLHRQAAVGQTLVSRLKSVPLVTVAEAGRMVARAELSLEQVSRLKPGQALTVVVDDHRYQGHVRRLGLEPSAGGGSKRYPVDVVFALPDGQLLRAGQAATVELP